MYLNWNVFINLNVFKNFEPFLANLLPNFLQKLSETMKKRIGQFCSQNIRKDKNFGNNLNKIVFNFTFNFIITDTNASRSPELVLEIK